MYPYGATGFPTNTYGATNYWVDVRVRHGQPEAPAVIDHAPRRRAAVRGDRHDVAATFSEAVDGSVASMTDDAADAADSDGRPVAYDAARGPSPSPRRPTCSR